MAEGIQVSSSSPKYFCHHCSREVSPCREDELICPECSSGFLEEVSKDLYEAENISLDGEDDYESESEDLSLISGLGMENLIGHMLLNVSTMDEPDAPFDPTRPEVEHNFPSPESLADLFQQLPNFSDSPSRSDLVRFRYFDDFGGDDELDAITSQLLDEAELSGPPPLLKEQIKALPTVTLTREDVEKGLQCTVCMDDFSIRDKAKTLPCNHLYHEKCITPWLERQATCPNCRTKIVVPPPSKRSRSCPRTSRLNPRSLDSRRYSEATSLSDFFTTSLNPFRSFLN